MRWRAHELDGRISASNALKIRAALRQAARWERIFEAYKRSQPAITDNPAQNRARARAWALLNVRFDNTALIAALRRTWAEGFALGIISADDAIRQAQMARKADDPDYIDWKNWKPGDSAAALIVKPTKAFQRLLESQGITIRGVDQTGYDRLGTALADALAVGLSGNRAAKLIMDSVSDPARALTIAITETNRAVSRATIERYQSYGLERMEWTTSDPCPICLKNEGVTINVGGTFPSGDTQPPAHPNCRCALLPVIEGFEETPVDGITNIVPPVVEEDYSQLAEIRDDNEQRALLGFQQETDPGFTTGGNTLTREMQDAVMEYRGTGYQKINDALRDPVRFMNSVPQVDQDVVMGYVRNIEMAMDLAPRTTKPFLSFRGVVGDAATRLGQLQPGAVFVDDGFASTTLRKNIAVNFARADGLVVEIVNPAGSKGIMIDGFTGFAFEREWLLPAGSRFEVISNDGRIMRVRVIK